MKHLILALLTVISSAAFSCPGKSECYVQIYDRFEGVDPSVPKGVAFFNDLYQWEGMSLAAQGVPSNEPKFSNMDELNFLRSKDVGLYFCENAKYRRASADSDYVGVVLAGECRVANAKEQSLFNQRLAAGHH